MNDVYFGLALNSLKYSRCERSALSMGQSRERFIPIALGVDNSKRIDLRQPCHPLLEEKVMLVIANSP